MVPKGHIVAWEQFSLFKFSELYSFSKILNEPAIKKGHSFREVQEFPIFKSVNEKKDRVEIIGKDFVVVFSKETGTIESWKWQGKELLLKGLQPNFWRTPTDNDFGNQMPKRMEVWRYASDKKNIIEINSNSSESIVSFSVKFEYPTILSYGYLNYMVCGDGRIIVSHMFETENKKLPNLPKFGLYMEIPREFDNMTWFGRGPHESYIDRKASTKVDIFSGKVEDQ